MKALNLLSKAIKIVGISIVGVIFIGLIGYVVSTAPLSITIAFMVILGLLLGYFGAIMKLGYEKKKRETDIDEKIKKQEFHMKMTEVPRQEKKKKKIEKKKVLPIKKAKKKAKSVKK